MSTNFRTIKNEIEDSRTKQLSEKAAVAAKIMSERLEALFDQKKGK